MNTLFVAGCSSVLIFLVGVSNIAADTRSFTSKRPPSVSKVITAPAGDTAIPNSTNAAPKKGVEAVESAPVSSPSASPVPQDELIEPERDQEAEVFPPPNADE